MRTEAEIQAQIEQDIALLRTIIVDPVSIKWAENMDIEVRPDTDDDRVLIGRKDWGYTVVNYTSAWLKVDVFPECPTDSIHAVVISSDELIDDSGFATEGAPE